MGNTEEANIDMMRRLQNSFGVSSNSIRKVPLSINQLEPSQMRTHIRHFTQNVGLENGKRAGIPPSHPNQITPNSPYSRIPVSPNGNQQVGLQNFSPGSSHSRSLSQSSFFSLDILPPLSPSTYNRDSPSMNVNGQVLNDVSMEDRDAISRALLPPRAGETLPPRKAHRRSNSDIPFGVSTVMHSSLRSPGAMDRLLSGKENYVLAKPMVQLVKQETSGDRNTEGAGERKSEGEVVDDLFSAYMNLDNIDSLNSSGADEKKHGSENHEDLDSSRASGTKTNDSSENEAESTINQKREGVKRSACGDIAPTTKHYRSISMDSFMDKLHFGDESPTFPQSPGNHPGQLSASNSMDGKINSFSMEFGNGEFSGAELKKIMANDKLSEIALSDPKRVKRILANRQSAARSKERKMRYVSELEHKVQTLQTEATTLSAQLTLLQRDSAGISSQNNELKFRLQAMEQQAQLRDALNEALTAEVQRLKQQSVQLNLHQLQLQEPQEHSHVLHQQEHAPQLPHQQQNDTTTTH